jgi:hypothetical protein
VLYQLVDGQDTPNKENVDPNETDDWFHRNDSFHADNVDNISNELSGNLTVANMTRMTNIFGLVKQ